ncbi:MAG: RHS repeat protein, partial [Clostridia bacterium]|nr:RHS repeat protein [Clostridia bacterium]
MAVYLNGKEYITVSAPYAYDANGNEICVKSKLDGNLLRYEADAKGDTVYPVTIDPYISYYNSSETMYTAFIYNKSPNSNYRYNYLYCGVRTATSGNPEYITFVRPLSLAAQRASDTILSAKIYMKVSDYGNLEWYLGAYPVKTAWTESGVTWNNMTPANDTHISYDMLSYISKVAGESWAGFDITEAYKGWYKKDAAGNHTNYGIAIRRACAASYNYAEFYSSRISEGKPYITVNYVSHAGRKGWWKYETMGAGRAGAVYTDIYNGNLIAEHADTATAGSRMPVSLSHIYNSCLSDEDAAYCGLGWRLSLSQSLRKETIVNKQYYIWQDGDGTEHYFEASGTQPYSDSEGMQLKLRVNGSDITVTDKSDTVMSFPVTTSATRVYLSSVTDAQGNSMTLSYDPGAAGKLVSVTDGVGRVTVLGYNADGLLGSITAPGCPVVSYTYSGDSTDGWRLTRINYSDIDSTQYTEYGYDVHDGIQTATLTVLRNYDGIQTNVVYDTELDTTYIGNYTEQTRKVVSLEQTGDENGVTVKGAKKLIQYGHMHTGIKHVSGTDSDDDGRSIINHFNNAGNVLSAHDEMWHAAAARYDSGIDNTPSATSGVIKSIINRLPNTDMYSGWTQVKAYSGDTRTFDTGVTCMGMPSAKLVKNGAGEFKERITAKLFGSGEYTLSAYLKTNGLTVPGGCKGAFLRVTANGNTYESRGALSATAGMGTGTFAEGWERLNVCFPFEYGTDVSVTAELVCDASGGTLYWSCPQLEEGRLAGSFNLLSDGDFSLTVTNNDGSAPRLWPQKWNKVGTVGTSAFNCVVLDRSVNGLPDGVSGNALRLKCTPRTTDVYMAQEVRACGANGDVFTIAGWCSADKTAIGTSGYAPMLGVRFYSSSNTYSSWKYISFGTQRSGWHLVRQQV